MNICELGLNALHEKLQYLESAERRITPNSLWVAGNRVSSSVYERVNDGPPSHERECREVRRPHPLSLLRPLELPTKTRKSGHGKARGSIGGRLTLIGECTNEEAQKERRTDDRERIEKEDGTHQIPHNLTSNIPPADQQTPRAHCDPLLGARLLLSMRDRARRMYANQPLTHRVRPNNHIPYRLLAMLQAIQNSNELHFQQRMQVLVPAVTYQRGLVPHGLEVDVTPGPRHVLQLLRVRHDGGECLCDLVDVEEAQDKVPEARAELDFGLDKGGAVPLQ